MLFAEPMAIGPFTLDVVVTDPPWFENCYIVRHTASGAQAVFDPGSSPERIAAKIQSGGGAPDAIYLTHGHPDHLGAVAALQTRFGVACHAHRDERPLVAGAAALSMMLAGIPVEPPAACQWFGDEAAFTLGGERFSVLPTPGHTPGGVCFVFPGFALTGDTLFQGGIGRTDLPGGDARQLDDSITRLLAALPRETLLFSGHGPYWTVREARAWWG